jgi:hypothetical protein
MQQLVTTETLEAKSDASGLSSKNSQLDGEALSDEFDRKIRNPHGIEIDLPLWVGRG